MNFLKDSDWLPLEPGPALHVAEVLHTALRHQDVGMEAHQGPARLDTSMDKKISAAIWSEEPNGRGGFSTYTNSCPKIEKFRTIIGTPAGKNDLLTAYKVDQTRAAAAAKC